MLDVSECGNIMTVLLLGVGLRGMSPLPTGRRSLSTTAGQQDTKTANNTSESPVPWRILWWLHIFYCVILFILGDFEVDFEVEVNAC